MSHPTPLRLFPGPGVAWSACRGRACSQWCLKASSLDTQKIFLHNTAIESCQWIIQPIGRKTADFFGGLDVYLMFVSKQMGLDVCLVTKNQVETFMSWSEMGEFTSAKMQTRPPDKFHELLVNDGILKQWFMKSSCNWVGCYPLKAPNNKVFFHCSLGEGEVFVCLIDLISWLHYDIFIIMPVVFEVWSCKSQSKISELALPPEN